MTIYKITIIWTTGKNKGLKVSYSRKKLDVILEIAKKEMLEGNSVKIEVLKVPNNIFDVLEALDNLS